MKYWVAQGISFWGSPNHNAEWETISPSLPRHPPEQGHVLSKLPERPGTVVGTLKASYKYQY